MPLVPYANVGLLQTALTNLFAGPGAVPVPMPVPEFVGVFDIGTGNLHAVFDADGRPFLYTDIGGGALGSTFTFPGHLQLCTHRLPLIVLTHFDQDHWRSAVAAGGGLHAPPLVVAGAAAIDAQAALCPWLIPTQAKGGVQTAFYNCLVAGANNIHRRPGGAAATVLNIGARVRILKCTGNGANHSGLAVMLLAAAGGAGRMLLPGDAHFVHFAHGAGNNVHAMVATHHGADPGAVPNAPAGGSPVSYSYGWGNAYGFPRLAAGGAYVAANFPDARRMDTAGAEGAADIAGPRGNVALCWPGAVGPGARPAPGAAAAVVQAAALAVLASSATAVEAEVGAGLALAQKGQIACAAAWQAMELLHVPAAGPPSLTANLFLALPGPMAPPSLLPPMAAASLWLTAADGQRMAATTTLLAAPVPADIATIAQCLRVAHSALAPVVSFEAWNAWGGGGNIQTASSPARAAAYAAMGRNGLGGQAAQAAVAALLAPLLAAPPVPPLEGGLLLLGARAISKAARLAHSRPGTGSLRAPAVAEQLGAFLIPLGGGLTQAQIAGLAAGAAMQPGIATNPEAPNGIPALAGADIGRVENAMKTAIAAAVVGVAAGAATALAARAAVAAAMAALGAVAGAPQPGCHRHPSACGGNSCRLTLHYVP